MKGNSMDKYNNIFNKLQGIILNKVDTEKDDKATSSDKQQAKFEENFKKKLNKNFNNIKKSWTSSEHQRDTKDLNKIENAVHKILEVFPTLIVIATGELEVSDNNRFSSDDFCLLTSKDASIDKFDKQLPSTDKFSLGSSVYIQMLMIALKEIARKENVSLPHLLVNLLHNYLLKEDNNGVDVGKIGADEPDLGNLLLEISILLYPPSDDVLEKIDIMLED